MQLSLIIFCKLKSILIYYMWQGSGYTDSNSKLQEAAERGDVEAIDRCIIAGADVNARGPGLWSGRLWLRRGGGGRAWGKGGGTAKLVLELLCVARHPSATIPCFFSF
jgi:hypothetical protein